MKLKIVFIIISSLFFQSIFSQNIDLYNQFSGKIDFTMIGNTLNTQENGNVSCTILTSSTATLSLGTNDTVVSAYLYWSGSGSGDFEVALNNQAITAERTFNLNTAQLTYFSAFADITNQVLVTGNGNYTLSDLDLTNVIDDYCVNATNFGGWAIIIVYSNVILPINQVNIYDGLESISSENPDITIQLNSLNVIDNIGAKVGFLAWEGDSGIAINETLKVNGNLLSNPPLNPANNVFNGTNSFTGANNLYNMDLDFYNIENYINVGDTSATIQLTSSQDFVMLNSVVSKLNLQLPDAVVAINSFQLLSCNEREVEVDFTVSNIDLDGILNANTPVSIYADNTFVVTFFTQNTLLPNQSENFNEIINIPNNVPEDFILKLVVDDDGNGNSTVLETNELNNEDEIAISLFEVPIANPVPDLALCDDEPNTIDSLTTFDTSEVQNILLGGINEQTNMDVFYFDDQGNPLSSPLPNPFTTASQTITVVIENPINTTCNASTTIDFVVVPFPIANVVTINSECDDDQDGLVLFDTSQIENIVLQGQLDVTLTYFNENGTQILPTLPNPFETNSQIITIIATSDIANDLNGACSDQTTLEFVVDELPYIAEAIIIDPLCDDAPNDLDGLSDFDTSQIESSILGSQINRNIYYFAENGDVLPSPLPNPFTTATQTISVVVENQINTDCIATTTIDFEVILLPDFEVFDDTLCLNFLPTPLIVNIENAQGSYNYEWMNSNGEIIGLNEDQLAIVEAGIYTVTATTQDGLACATTKTFTITETIVEITQPDNLLECDEGLDTAIFNLEETIDQITLESFQEITFFITEEDLILDENEIEFPNQYTNTSDPQTIYVRVENPTTNCYAITTFLLETEDCFPVIPEIFTPNGDEHNPTFTINGLHDIFLDFEMYIYNRYGNLVYKGNNNKPDWDGTYKDKDMPVGTYFYRLYFNDEETLYAPVRGWVYLNR